MQNYLKQIIEDLKNIPIASFVKLVNFNKRFIFMNKKYPYFIHYRSWGSERVVEIPIILDYITKDKKILEFGNVLMQFVNVWWDVVDKYEQGSEIINKDILDFRPDKKYDLIVSISTIEHVGFNEDVSSGKQRKGNGNIVKIKLVIEHLKSLLDNNGIAIMTFPIGYNKELDYHMDEVGFNEICFLRRVSGWNLWEEIEKKNIVGMEYGYPYNCGNYIGVGIIRQ